VSEDLPAGDAVLRRHVTSEDGELFAQDVVDVAPRRRSPRLHSLAMRARSVLGAELARRRRDRRHHVELDSPRVREAGARPAWRAGDRPAASVAKPQ
jgi:hypothetical protein